MLRSAIHPDVTIVSFPGDPHVQAALRLAELPDRNHFARWQAHITKRSGRAATLTCSTPDSPAAPRDGWRVTSTWIIDFPIILTILVGKLFKTCCMSSYILLFLVLFEIDTRNWKLEKEVHITTFKSPIIPSREKAVYSCWIYVWILVNTYMSQKCIIQAILS